jgi:hypothetical protein
VKPGGVYEIVDQVREEEGTGGKVLEYNQRVSPPADVTPPVGMF